MPGLRPILVSLSPVLGSAAILTLGFALLSTLVPVRLSLEAIPVGLVGVVSSLYFVGFVLGTLACPAVVERVGHIRTFAAFAATAAACSLGHALVVDPVVWGVLRLGTGFSIAFLFVIVESWLNARSPNAVRGAVMATYMAVYYSSAGGGQALLTLADPAGHHLFVLAAMMIALSLVPLALSPGGVPPTVSGERLGLRRLIAISPLGVAGCLCTGLLIGAIMNLGPLYALSLNADSDWIAAFMATVLIGGFLLQYPLGRLSDRFDRRTVILWLCVATTALAVVLFVLPAPGPWVILPLIALYGGLTTTLYPISLSHANDFMDSAKLVPASAGLLLCFGGGAVLGPAVAGPVMGMVGPEGLFLFSALVGAGLSLFTLVRMGRRSALPNAEQSSFVAVPVTSSAVVELDPRAETPIDAQLSFEFVFAPPRSSPVAPSPQPDAGPAPRAPAVSSRATAPVPDTPDPPQHQLG